MSETESVPAIFQLDEEPQGVIMIPDSSTRTELNDGSRTEVLVNYWNKLSYVAVVITS